MREYAREVFERLGMQLAHTLGCDGPLEEPATAGGAQPVGNDEGGRESG